MRPEKFLNYFNFTFYPKGVFVYQINCFLVKISWFFPRNLIPSSLIRLESVLFGLHYTYFAGQTLVLISSSSEQDLLSCAEYSFLQIMIWLEVMKTKWCDLYKIILSKYYCHSLNLIYNDIRSVSSCSWSSTTKTVFRLAKLFIFLG